MKYSIDTSAIIEGWHRKYPPDVFPKLWKNLDKLINEDEIRASEEVFYELKKKDDDIFNWAQNRPKLFVQIDIKIQQVVSNILKKYEKMAAERKSKSSADPFVIALAQINNACVVTEELLLNNITNPNIPDVCIDLGIPWTNLLGLIKKEGWVFNT